MTKEERKEYDRQRYLKNRDRLLERKKQYYQENKEEIAEYNKQHYQDNKDRILEQVKQYRQDNKDKVLEYQKQYRQTPMGRAICLVSRYRQADKEANRGECTLTPQWVIDNILSGQKCHYCEETDWTKLGCDRIDNDKPHTPDNVVCCCDECNVKRGTKTYEEFITITNLNR